MLSVQKTKHTRNISLCNHTGRRRGVSLLKFGGAEGGFSGGAHTHTVQKKSLMAIGQYNKRHEKDEDTENVIIRDSLYTSRVFSRRRGRQT